MILNPHRQLRGESRVTENFEVRNEEAERVLRNVGGMLGRIMPEDFGFALELFTFGPGGSMFYTSNARREDMIRMLREMIEGNNNDPSV